MNEEGLTISPASVTGIAANNGFLGTGLWRKPDHRYPMVNSSARRPSLSLI